MVIGQPGNPNASALPGLSSSYEQAFRVDTTAPTVVAASLAAGGSALPLGGTSTPLNGLTNLSLDVEDPASPATGPLATPISVYYPALNPSTASNTSNYSLINTTTDTDESQFIASATFTATDSTYGVGTSPDRTSTSQGYYGRVDLTFAAGLPAGEYEFIAHTSETLNGTVYSGLTDAAGNPLNETSVPGEGSGGNKDFIVNFDIQPSPVYIESVSTNVNNAQGNTLLPDSYYEINPRAGDIVSAPPTTFYVDFSSPLNPSADYSNAIQLIRSANQRHRLHGRRLREPRRGRPRLQRHRLHARSTRREPRFSSPPTRKASPTRGWSFSFRRVTSCRPTSIASTCPTAARRRSTTSTATSSTANSSATPPVRASTPTATPPTKTCFPTASTARACRATGWPAARSWRASPSFPPATWSTPGRITSKIRSCPARSPTAPSRSPMKCSRRKPRKTR